MWQKEVLRPKVLEDYARAMDREIALSDCLTVRVMGCMG